MQTHGPDSSGSNRFAGLTDTRLMEVTLTRDGAIRCWKITAWSMGWNFSYAELGCVTVNGCTTLEDANAKQREWEAEIDAARADGWA